MVSNENSPTGKHCDFLGIVILFDTEDPGEIVHCHSPTPAAPATSDFESEN